MRYFLSWLLLLFWGLWIGGQATLVLLIVTLFRRDPMTAIQAGPHMFPVFERYQLMLAVVAIAVSTFLAMLTRRKLPAIVVACLVAAGIGATLSRASITPQMVTLWQQHRAGTPEFNSLHHRSEMIYQTEFLLLLLAGALLPATLRGVLQRAPEDSRESAPPAEPADRIASA